MAPADEVHPARVGPFRIDPWLVDPARNRITEGDEARHLEPQLMDLLVLLASRGGDVVSKDEILEAVWHGRFIAEATLTRSVADLRRALGDDARTPRFIETIPKRGYRLAIDAEWIAPAADAPLSRGRAFPDADATHGPVPPSLAVLPFIDLGPEPLDRSFGQGLAEEVIHALTRIPPLRVIARTSSFAAAAIGGDVSTIGGRLGVTHVLEGSVRCSAGRVRVVAQLLRVSDARHLWSERYDRALADVLTLQDEISQAIAERLEISLEDIAGSARRAPADPLAYAPYLEARQNLFQGTLEGLDRSRQCLDEALRIDPCFAPAHDALSEVYWYMGFYGLLAPAEAFLRSVWACLRALELDEGMAEAHAQLAMLRKELDYNWAEVRRELRRAQELDPYAPKVRLRRAAAGLLPFGELEEATREVTAALASDPLSPFIRWWLAAVRFLSCDAEGTLREADRLLEIAPFYPPGHQIRGAGHLLRGETEMAVRCCQRAAELGGGASFFLGWLGQAYAMAGQEGDALAVRQELRERACSGYVPPTAMAWISLALGDVDDGFEHLAAAVEQRDPMIMPILSYPFLVPFRSDPRFGRLLEGMRLVAGTQPEPAAGLLLG